MMSSHEEEKVINGLVHGLLQANGHVIEAVRVMLNLDEEELDQAKAILKNLRAYRTLQDS